MLNNKSRGYFTLGDGNTTFFLAVIMMLVLSNVLSPIITVLPRIISNQAVVDVLTVALNSLIQIGMLLVFFNFSRIRGRKPAIYFNKVGVLSIIGGVLTALIALVSFFGIAQCFDFLLQWYGFKLGNIDGGTVTVPGMVATLILTCVMAPFCEELIFRGALLSGLNRGFKTAGSVLLCGFCFAMMHMNPAQTVYQFCLGCFLALLALKTRSIIPTIIAHSVSNIVACLLEFIPSFNGFVANLFSNASLIGIIFVSLGIAVAGALILTGIICLIGKLERRLRPEKFEDPVAKEPDFFDQSTLQPVYKDDVDYEAKRRRLFTPKVASYDVFTGEPVMKTEYSPDMQLFCKQRHEKKWGENGGIFGAKTAKIALAIALGICAFMWLAAFFLFSYAF